MLFFSRIDILQLLKVFEFGFLLACTLFKRDPQLWEESGNLFEMFA